MARIQKPQGQSLTSSTLQWVDLQSGQAVPENSLRISTDGPYWCRAKQRGTWAAGAVENGKCLIPFLGKVHTLSEYDVLLSINGSARIIEEEWDRLQAFPDHGISTPDMLLAITTTENGLVLPGYVSANERRAYFLKEDKFHRQDSAKILTESEPQYYKVDHVVRSEDKSQTVKREEVVANTTLSNPSDSIQPISDMLDYAAREIIYWGRIRGTITGLQCTVTEPSGLQRDITWGIENELDHYEQQLVEYQVPGEASVDVKLIAVMEKYEAPYSAMLTSVYSDGVQRQHPISGLHIHTRLAELRADFSQPFFTVNKTEIQGEYIPSQILIHSTTTTTTTTTTLSPDTASNSDGDKPQSDSLATSQSGSQTRPVAEQMSGAGTNVASIMLLFCFTVLLVSQPVFNFETA
ncbi:hypothetical protein SK128_027751 [Halocaridina rubra]|uniref:Protein unzipped n=1 Tax=Halocaridina rubra TaxID=373956 RepID=A0AAN9AGP1_HALRR